MGTVVVIPASQVAANNAKELTSMYLGTAIGMIAIGAILAFAVEFEIAGINIDIVGWILMIVGAVGVVLALTMTGRRTTTTGVPREREVVRERDPY